MWGVRTDRTTRFGGYLGIVAAGTPGSTDIAALRQQPTSARADAGTRSSTSVKTASGRAPAKPPQSGVHAATTSATQRCDRAQAAQADDAPGWVRFAGQSQLKATPGDPMLNLAKRRRQFLADRRWGGAAHAATIAQVRAKRVEAMSAAFAESTKGMQLTAMRAFIEFCIISGVDYREFGSMDGDRAPSPAQLGAEGEFLADFACYVVLFPRTAGAGPDDHNQGSTAVSYVSHVRSWYETNLVPPRRPGSGFIWNKNDHLGAALRRCLDGLRKIHPRTGTKSRPIERHVMVKLGQALRGGDRWQRTKWAIYSTCWQGGRRIGECIRSGKRSGPWDPARDMHRGRAEFVRDEETGAIRSIRVAIGPNKTDVRGEKDFHMHLPVAAHAEVNAASAVIEMLEIDPTPPGQEARTPMFRDWRQGGSGGMISYHTLRRELAADLAAVGEGDLAAGPHSFRRGCATALGGIGAPDSVTRMIGLWATNANLGYTWASSPIVERKMLEMAEWDARADVARGPIVSRR